MKPPYSADSYDTPLHTPLYLLHKLFCGNRLIYHFYSFLSIGMASIKASLGIFGKKEQIISGVSFSRAVEKSGGKIHIRGVEHIRNLNEPVVIVCNHMSIIETIVINGIIREHLDFTFVIKDSLLKTPFFGKVMKAIKAIPLTRADPKADFKTIMTQGKKNLEKGRSIVIFPEGTRSEKFNPDKFGSIGTKLAKNAKVKLIPLALKTNYVEQGKIFKNLGALRQENELYFEFDRPLEITGNGRTEQQHVVEFIDNRLKYWYKLDSENNSIK
ncbi:lysophospholipid acyltransferase family protein [Lentisphaerota bacterium WC36G]|nr:1-acyl-sn-glycerol-3-phosphate acyltransferase [Lentisphaerae bacterium WC36]